MTIKTSIRSNNSLEMEKTLDKLEITKVKSDETETLSEVDTSLSTMVSNHLLILKIGVWTQPSQDYR